MLFVRSLLATLIVMLAGRVVRSFTLGGKNPSRFALNRVLGMSGGARDGEMAPFYALGVNVARQVGGELKNILSKEEISAMLEVRTCVECLPRSSLSVEGRQHLYLRRKL